jgi:hypothetical protein
MHLSLGFILLLVSSITLALSVSHPKSNKPVAKPTGCQKSDSPFYEFLVVTVEDDMEFTFAIRTPYTNYYPDTSTKHSDSMAFRPKICARGMHAAGTKLKL